MYIAKRRMWALPALAIAMLLVVSALFGFSPAVHAQGTAAGDYCVEGIVIDWEEEPMGGVLVTLTLPDGTEITDTTDDGSDEPADKGKFKFEAPNDPVPWMGEPGEYTAAVTLPAADWEGVTATSFSFNIDANTDGCVKIRFKLRQIVQVTVYKIDADHNPLPEWTIDAVPGGGNLFAEPQSADTDDTGAAIFTLTPGVWIFMERQPASDEKGIQPDRFQPVLPHTGRTELDVQPLEGEDPPYIIVFKNEFKDNGCIAIRKLAETPDEAEFTGPYGAAGWGFALERSDGTVARTGVTDAEGYLTFTGLPYGPYTIVEEDRAGWAHTSTEAVAVIVNSGECILQEFLNEQDDSGFCIEGYKYDVNGMYGIPDWRIKVAPLDDGGYDPDKNVDPDVDENIYTNGLGYYKIEFPGNDYRIPGSSYELCEDVDNMDGWLPRTPVCQIVKLPMQPGHCVQALDFVNEQVGHTEAEKLDAKHMAMMEELKENAGKDMTGGEKDHGMPADMSGGASWDGSGDAHCSTYHVVAAGEGLFDIGFDYGKSAQQMVDANPDVKAPDYTIYVGQKICVP